MKDNNDLLFATLITILIVGIFVGGSTLGYNIGKNETIKYCMEKPQDCKIQYDYLKLQENQK
jgi:hypothetical protein